MFVTVLSVPINLGHRDCIVLSLSQCQLAFLVAQLQRFCSSYYNKFVSIYKSALGLQTIPLRECPLALTVQDPLLHLIRYVKSPVTIIRRTA